MTKNNEKDIFDLVVKTTLQAVRHFAQNRNEANFQILDVLMPKERRIRSIVGGLETSLGTTLWEPLAKGLASLNGFEILNGKLILQPDPMPEGLEDTLNKVISSREKQKSIYDDRTSREEIKKSCIHLIKNPVKNFCSPPRGSGVDVWLRKEGIDYLFDIKTVQPNIGGYKSYLREIMTWYAYYYSKLPRGEARAFIFIPYNPYKVDFFKGTIGHGFPLSKNELWVQDTLWDFCSGTKNTFKIIHSAFGHINDKQLVSKELNKLFEGK